MARHGRARHGPARHGTARQGTARHGPAGHGTARHGRARHGTARQGRARQGPAGGVFSWGGAAGLAPRRCLVLAAPLNTEIVGVTVLLSPDAVNLQNAVEYDGGRGNVTETHQSFT